MNSISVNEIQKEKYNDMVLKCVNLLKEYETILEELERLSVSTESKYEEISNQAYSP